MLLLAYIDGGSRGNPCCAGCGVLFTDQAGRQLVRLSRYLGRQTNNCAEYSGLLTALQFALASGCNMLTVRSDSEVVVKQMRGEYQVKSPALRELHQRATALRRRLQRFAIEHIPRERNQEADRLANLAMDTASDRCEGSL